MRCDWDSHPIVRAIDYERLWHAEFAVAVTDSVARDELDDIAEDVAARAEKSINAVAFGAVNDNDNDRVGMADSVTVHLIAIIPRYADRDSIDRCMAEFQHELGQELYELEGVR